MEDIRKMKLGNVVDFCISYNERHKEEQQEEEKKNPKYRMATPEETRAYFGL